MGWHFCLSVRLLDSMYYHGQGDGGSPEWPPSPLRVFQALAAAAARRNGGAISDADRSALTWLEGQREAPVVIAPRGAEGAGYRLSVPNNAMDIVARAWAKGIYSGTGDANPGTHRTMKAVRPVLLREESALHYIWRLPEPVGEETRRSVAALSEMAEGMAALGWGLDLAIGHAEVLDSKQVEELPGERWLPTEGAGKNSLRIPAQGTLEDLVYRHERFLERIGEHGFVPPPPLSAYRKTEYRRATEPAGREFAAFALLQPDAGNFRPFDSARRGLTVAGMVRGVVRAAAERSGWSESKIASFVLGHGEARTDREHVAVGPRRFAYVPLPSMEARGGGHALTAGSVRRVMLTTFESGCTEEIRWAARMISGQELTWEHTKEPAALLSLIPASDRGLQRYTKAAAEWATVTPVILPGYDDPKHYRRRMEAGVESEEQRDLLARLDARIDGLIRKAIVQAGFAKPLADSAEIEWRQTGFWPGTDLAGRYGAPDHLKRFARYHVKIRWRDARGEPAPVRGPVCIGGGRFCGLGLFAAV